VMVNYEYFNKMKFKLKIIEIYRNPFDIIFSWYKKGWGYRWQNDPRIFDIRVKHNNKLFPWYVAGKEKKWANKNHIERCALIVIDLTRKAIRNHKKIKFKKNIYTLSYENFLQNTDMEIKKICNFLKTKKNSFTTEQIKKENCPTMYNVDRHLKLKSFIKLNVNNKIFSDIQKLSNFYKKNIYNLK